MREREWKDLMKPFNRRRESEGSKVSVNWPARVCNPNWTAKTWMARIPTRRPCSALGLRCWWMGLDGRTRPKRAKQKAVEKRLRKKRQRRRNLFKKSLMAMLATVRMLLINIAK